MTRKVIEKMPVEVMNYINNIRTSYKNGVISYDELRHRAIGYCTGLRDAGLITDRERTSLFIYCTL